MANLKHVVSDLHQVYLTEMEAKIKPQLDKSSAPSSGSDSGDNKDSSSGGGDNLQKAARQLAYDTRYKARREGIPLERAFTQSVQNSSASAPVKDAAKALLFSGEKKESVEVEGSIEEARKGDKEKVRVEPKKGYGKGYVRFANPKKKHELRSNPQIQSVTPTDHGDAYEGEKSKKKPGKLDPVGKEDGDVDNDGDKDSSDKYLMKRRKAIGKAISKDPKESFSNWKEDLGLVEDTMVEVAGEGDEKMITGKKKVRNKVKIHPELQEGIGKLGGEVIEIDELSEEKPYEKIDRLNKARVAKDAAASVAKKSARDKNTAAFQAHRKDVLAKGGRPVDALDSWQKKKMKNEEASASSQRAQQQLTQRTQVQNARLEMEKNKTAAGQAKIQARKSDKELNDRIRSVANEESELDERTRYAKETGKDPQTGRPSERGGTIKPGSAMSKVRKDLAGKGLMSSRGKGIQPQGKTKEKGAKGYQGQTPVDKIKARLAKNRAPQPNPYRPRAGESD
jgi:hypothetical protein